MKSKIFKALTWVGGLFLLTAFLLSHNATAQSCPAPQSTAYSNSHYPVNGGHYYASNNSYSGKGNKNYRKGGNRHHNFNRNHSANRRSNQHHNYGIGTQLWEMPYRAQRIVDRRGRVLYASQGLLWQEQVCPRRGRNFRAVNWIR